MNPSKRLKIELTCKQNSAAASSKPIPVTLKTAWDVLNFLRSIFPVEKFDKRLPPIILKHQVYSFITNKTLVDNEINILKQNGNIRCFHFGCEADDIYVVFTEDFKNHIERVSNGNATIDRFLQNVLQKTTDLSLSRDVLLKNFVNKEEDITELMNSGLLAVQDVGRWWLSIPYAGEFMKTFISGRKALLMMVKKCKYGEVLQQDLEKRRMPKFAKLGILYHIHDMVGLELVTVLNTTSGKLLRYKE